jgi:hypothetical protein
MKNVDDFLNNIHSIIKENGVKILPRPENISMMYMLGFNQIDVENVLLSLTKKEYCEGPVSDDKGRPDSVWIFGQNIDGHDVYIKLVIMEKKKRKKVICISFHESTSPLFYPYR